MMLQLLREIHPRIRTSSPFRHNVIWDMAPSSSSTSKHKMYACLTGRLSVCSKTTLSRLLKSDSSSSAAAHRNCYCICIGEPTMSVDWWSGSRSTCMSCMPFECVRSCMSSITATAVCQLNGSMLPVVHLHHWPSGKAVRPP